jgi:hypothetical protein
MIGAGAKLLSANVVRSNPSLRSAVAQNVWITNRSNLPGSSALMSVTYQVSRVAFVSPNRPIKNPRFGFVNWYLSPSGGAEDFTNLGSVKIRHSIEFAGQTKIENSDGEVTLAAGQTYEGSAFNLTIPANTEYWIVTMTTYTAGAQHRPIQYYPTSTRGEGVVYTSTQSTALTNFTGTFTTSSTSNAYGPAYGYGEVVGEYLPSFALSTDSIGTGTQDNVGADDASGLRTGGDSKYNIGYLRRGLHGINGYGVLNLGRAGATLESSVGANFARRKAIISKATTHIISQLGQNNVSLGEANVKAGLDAVWAELDDFGLPIIQMDLCPFSTGTWTSYAGQNPGTGTLTLRANLRDYNQSKVGSVLYKVYKPYDTLSPAFGDPNYGLWVGETAVGGVGQHTDDGTHPNYRGYSATGAHLGATNIL